MCSDIKRNNLGNAFVFMVRYALPRKTSADMATTTALRWWWDEIPEVHRQRIIAEIEECKDLYGNDPFLWDDFLKWVETAERIMKG
jgi:hypothetical protein